MLANQNNIVIKRYALARWYQRNSIRVYFCWRWGNQCDKPPWGQNLTLPTYILEALISI